MPEYTQIIDGSPVTVTVDEASGDGAGGGGGATTIGDVSGLAAALAAAEEAITVLAVAPKALGIVDGADFLGDYGTVISEFIPAGITVAVVYSDGSAATWVRAAGESPQWEDETPITTEALRGSALIGTITADGSNAPFLGVVQPNFDAGPENILSQLLPAPGGASVTESDVNALIAAAVANGETIDNAIVARLATALADGGTIDARFDTTVGLINTAKTSVGTLQIPVFVFTDNLDPQLDGNASLLSPWQQVSGLLDGQVFFVAGSDTATNDGFWIYHQPDPDPNPATRPDSSYALGNGLTYADLTATTRGLRLVCSSAGGAPDVEFEIRRTGEDEHQWDCQYVGGRTHYEITQDPGMTMPPWTEVLTVLGSGSGGDGVYDVLFPFPLWHPITVIAAQMGTGDAITLIGQNYSGPIGTLAVAGDVGSDLVDGDVAQVIPNYNGYSSKIVALPAL